jgi:cytochrome c biogenesis protein CcmG/thiol:disulfide interchange protein DsbE
MIGPPRRKLAVVLALTVTAMLAGGCGSDEGGAYGGEAPDYERALAGAPPPLAEIYAQANELLPGGPDAFEARLAELRGYPVVVNKWASWCGPCRAEFPYFQDATVEFGKRVAFLGVNSEDSNDTAKQFLSEFPVPYPSYIDPGQEIAAVFNATLGFPSTAYYNSEGELIYLRQGGYPGKAELFADIRRYALRG